jgi:hypothetical protein
MRYYHDVYEINGSHYAVPDTFEDLDQDGYPILPISDGRMMVPDNFIELDNRYDIACRQVALRAYRDEWELRCVVLDDERIQLGNKVWLVVTDAEADDHVNAILEDFITENLNDAFRSYFNEKEWKEHMVTRNGRGYWLSRYDNLEGRQETVPNTYFLYRQR